MDQPDPSVFADAAPPDARAPGDDRQRDSLFLLAKMRLDGNAEPVPVRVRNLSPGGLMAELPHPIRTDSAIEIEVRGIGWIAGRVAWQTAGRVGVAFDHEIDPQLARRPTGD